MVIYIGIDDTDNLETKGTGFRARTLAQELTEKGFGEAKGISRHQLFVSPEIPYTSHNSSLCIEFQAISDNLTELIGYCSDFMNKNCADGSDPGLCVLPSYKMPQEVIEFGKRAKVQVLKKEEALKISKEYDIHLSEHGGTGGGIIGALAGTGLRAMGQDGRYVWLKGIREMDGVYTADDILNMSGVQHIMTESGEVPKGSDSIDVGDWFRPVLLNGKPTLLVEKAGGSKARWRIIDRKHIKEKY